MQYRTGQIVLRKGDALITNDSAEFLANVKKGDRVFIRYESVSYQVHAVRSDTQIELSAPYRGDSKTTDYSIHLDYTQNYGLMMPYYGDFNVEDILRFNIGKIDAVMAARFCGASGASSPAAQTYTLSIEEFSINPPVAGNTSLSATWRVVRSHAVQVVETQLVITGPTPFTRPWETLSGDAQNETISVIRAPGGYVAALTARDNKGNETARTVTFTVQDDGEGALSVPGEWVFADVPTGNPQTIAARIDAANNATRVIAIVIQAGGQVSRALVAGGSFTANKDGPGGFRDYPVSVRFFNATKTETWTWPSAGAAPTLEGGGAYIGEYTVTATVPQAVAGSSNELRLAWSAVAPVDNVEVEVRYFYNGNWRDSLSRLMVFSPTAVQNHPTFEQDVINASGMFPVKYKFINATKTVELVWPNTTDTPVITETTHNPNVLSNALLSIESLTQLPGTLNAQVVFKVAAPNPAHPTHYLIKVDDQIVVSDTPVTEAGEITVTRTLAGLAVGERLVKVVGSGQAVADNELSQTINIQALAQSTAAPVLSNFSVTPGAGTAQFKLDIASAETVRYKLLRNGVEVFAETSLQAAGAVDKTVTVESGAAAFRAEVTDASGRTAQTDNITTTILAPAAGVATISNTGYAYASIDDGQGGTQTIITISATLDVPDQSYGIHWRVFSAATGQPVPAENTRPGFEWLPHNTEPVAMQFQATAPTVNTTYYIEACVQGQFTATTTTHIDATPPAAPGVDTITINVTNTSTVAATSYTLDATLSNTLAEAMEYRIMEGAVEKKAWTNIVSGGTFSETIAATAGTHNVSIEARSANIQATSSTRSIVVDAAAGGIQTGTFVAGTPLVLAGLFEASMVADWSVSPPAVTRTYTNLSGDTTHQIFERFMQTWESAFTTQVFYERDSGVATASTLNTLENSGDRVAYQVELRQADGTVLARLESEDLILP